jgi:hypothetical protein
MIITRFPRFVCGFGNRENICYWHRHFL